MKVIIPGKGLTGGEVTAPVHTLLHVSAINMALAGSFPHYQELLNRAYGQAKPPQDDVWPEVKSALDGSFPANGE
jgi:hypothetical protein